MVKYLKHALVATIRQGARQEAARLAGEFARADSGKVDKESVLAALEFEKWLVESCEICLTDR